MRAVAVVMLVSVGSLSAAEPMVPAVEIKVRAATDAVETLDYLVKLAEGHEPYAAYLKFAKLFAESKNGFLGIDPGRPMGAYVGVAPEIDDSPVVAMIPVTSEAEFLKTLKTFANLNPRKLDEGLYSFPIPGIPAGPGFLRFAHGYCYATIRSAKSIELAKLIAPKDFFPAKQEELVTVKVRIDGFPADIRKAILGQAELAMHEAALNAKGTELQQATGKFYIDLAADMLKTILEEGQSLDFAVKATPKTDDLAATLALTPKPGTGMAKYLKDQGTADSVAASMFSDSRLQTMTASSYGLTLPPECRKKAAALVDALLADAEGLGQAAYKEDLQALRKALKPMLERGRLHASQRMDVDPVSRKVGTWIALEVADGDNLEQLMKGSLKKLGEEVFTYDVDKAGGYRYHKLVTPAAKTMFGDSCELAVGNDLWAFGTGPKEWRTALDRKPRPAAFASQEISIGRLAATIGDPKLSEERVIKLFGKEITPGADRLRFALVGGDRLALEFTGKGKAVSLALFLSSLPSK